MPEVDENLLSRVATKLSKPPSYADPGSQESILTVAAASYGSRPTTDDDVTQPTGFDPDAAALFESVVESAYLVANADGEFDAAETEAFQHVVLTACGGAVGEMQMTALLADLHDQLTEDGVDKRVAMVARTIKKREHAEEILRVAALLANVSGGVSDIERDVLEKLAAELELEPLALERALSEDERAIAE
jgi:tellurite resistance protein